MDSTNLGVLIGASVGIVMVIALYVIGSRRDPAEALKNAPALNAAFQVYAPAQEVYHALMDFAQRNAWKVELTDEMRGQIVLGKNMSVFAFHNGLWLPITLLSNPNGTTTVQVGIKSKAYQYAFAMRPHLNRAVAEMQKIMTAGNLRVAK